MSIIPVTGTALAVDVELLPCTMKVELVVWLAPVVVLVAVTTTWCDPAARAVAGVNDQLPLVSAVVVPVCGAEYTVTVIVDPAGALPWIVGLVEVICASLAG